MPKHYLNSHLDMGDTAHILITLEIDKGGNIKVTQEEYFNYLKID